MEGRDLSVYLFYKNGFGVSLGIAKLKTLDGKICQEGDTEIVAVVPVDKIEDVLKMIRVSQLRPGDIKRLRSHTERETEASLDEHRQGRG